MENRDSAKPVTPLAQSAASIWPLSRGSERGAVMPHYVAWIKPPPLHHTFTPPPRSSPRRFPAAPRASSIAPEEEPSIIRRARPDAAGRRAPGSSPGFLEGAVDDLTNKRLGRGHVFYGRREEPDVAELGGASEVDDSGLGEILDYRPSPVTVLGAIDDGLLGQWIALGLVNMGFNVRVVADSMARAEELFGPDGATVDILVGDDSNEEWLRDALRGSVAAVWCSDKQRTALAMLKGNDQEQQLSTAVSAVRSTRGVKRFLAVVASDRQARLVSSAPSAIVVRTPVADEDFWGQKTPALRDEIPGKQKILLVGDGSEIPPSASIGRVDLAQVCCDVLQTDSYCGVLGERVQTTVTIPQDVVDLATQKGIEAVNLEPLKSGTIFVASGGGLPDSPAVQRHRLARTLEAGFDPDSQP